MFAHVFLIWNYVFIYTVQDTKRGKLQVGENSAENVKVCR